MGRQAAAQAQQEQEEVCISAKESFELVRCLLRVSIYHVSFLRGLFPDSMFTGAKMNNLGGVTVQMLGGDGVTLSSDAQQLKDWVEKGVLDAVRARYLKKMYFGIAADPDCTNILEEFVFTFQYGPEGAEMRIDAAAGGVQRATIDNLGGKGAAGQKGKSVSVKQVKNQIFRLMRTLVELCGTLEEVPETRHIFMRLTYHDDAPDEYEPPHFAPATEEQANGAFAAQPFSMKAGSLSTDHHRVSVRVKSLLDAVEPGGGEEYGTAAGGGEDDIACGADGLAPRTAAANGGGGGGLTAAPAAAAGAAAPPLPVKGDEGDEGGAGVDWSGGRGAGGGGQAAMEEERARPQGIRREEAQHDADLLGQSQEVEGPPGGCCDADMADAPLQEGEEGGGTGTPPPSDMTSGGGGGDCDDDAQGAMQALEELSLGAGLAPPPGCASQSSQQRALDAVRSHVLSRVSRGGSVEKLDAAAKFCSVPMLELHRLFDVLVAEGELVPVGSDRFARPGGGDSGERAAPTAATAAPPPSPLPVAAAMPPPPARRDGAVAPTPRGKRAAPARSPRGRGGGGAAAAHLAAAPIIADGVGMGAFDPEAPLEPAAGGASGRAAAAAAAGGAPGAVFDSSQTSRLGEGGAKRRRTKTSFCTAPISQGAIPGGNGGGGADGAIPGDSATVATTPNRSGNRGRARGSRRR